MASFPSLKKKERKYFRIFCAPLVAVVALSGVSSAQAEIASSSSSSIAIDEQASPHAGSGDAADPHQNGMETRATGTHSPEGEQQQAPVPGTAPQAPALQRTEEPPSEPRGAESETIIDMVHKEISRGIQGTATWMDSFFGNRRYDAELNESYVRFRYNMFLESGSKLVRKPDFQVRVILPQLREKTHLILSGTPKEETNFSPLQSNATIDPVATGDERNVSAAVQQTFLDTIKQSFAVRAGAKLHNQKPVLMLAPRYRLLLPLDTWNFRYIHEVTWTSNVGWAWNATFDAERPLPRDLFFRASNSWVWTEHTKGYLYAFVFSVGQPLGPRRGLSYDWVNVFHTQPINELTEVSLRVNYRQQLWRKWIYFDVSPQYRFPRDHSFHGLPGILFRIEMLLGNYR